ncbi:molybdenum cofactor biosynthesis protein MoaE [Notoacmeibacter ruber]|uniref:molybdenum cofactor biosynthesis protein MoaE n=1 Tax=Notoacmeibacter ruber TaxID=2670375 RepID=UPI0018F3BE57|nr:molybdenum cofactor biosynthesis protein MoaE [Notoacmeibacter ruber]
MSRTSIPIVVRIQTDDFESGAEIAALTDGRTDIGAVVSFTGLCRDDGEILKSLELEHYPGMAEAQIRQIAEEAATRWPLHGLLAIHRYGHIAPGEQIVLVAATSSHRQAAFDGANFLMDYLKTEAPFWKKEHLKDGSSGEWVSAKDSDDQARKRWEKG